MTEEQKLQLDTVSIGDMLTYVGSRTFSMSEELRYAKKKISNLEAENAELKSRIGMSVECDKAQKNGELCLGYGGDEDEPCEQCKNCIKCECGYYQLGETEKDGQLTKAKDIIKDYMIIVKGGNIIVCSVPEENRCINVLKLNEQAEQFLKESDNEKA